MFLYNLYTDKTKQVRLQEAVSLGNVYPRMYHIAGKLCIHTSRAPRGHLYEIAAGDLKTCKTWLSMQDNVQLAIDDFIGKSLSDKRVSERWKRAVIVGADA